MRSLNPLRIPMPTEQYLKLAREIVEELVRECDRECGIKEMVAEMIEKAVAANYCELAERCCAVSNAASDVVRAVESRLERLQLENAELRSKLAAGDTRCEHCNGAPAIGTGDECQWCDGSGLKPTARDLELRSIALLIEAARLSKENVRLQDANAELRRELENGVIALKAAYAERDRLGSALVNERKSHQETVGELHRTEAACCAENAELLKDKARLDWLELTSSEVTTVEAPEACPSKQWTIWRDYSDPVWLGRGPTFRKALDEAMADAELRKKLEGK